MVRLRNLKRNSSTIERDLVPEDSAQKGHLTVNPQNEDPYSSAKFVLPNRYEWCRNHANHAVTAILEMSGTSSLPNEKTVAWY